MGDDPEGDSFDEDDGIEFRVFCDKSNVTLTCGSGWWHQKGGEYDLCTAEYDKLPVAEKKQYVEVTTPEDLGEDLVSYMDDDDEDDGLEEMDPEQLMEALAEAFTAKHGRPPTEEEAKMFIQLMDEMGDFDDDDSDGWATDDGEEDSDEDGDIELLPDSTWTKDELLGYVVQHGGDNSDDPMGADKDKLLSVAKAIAAERLANAKAKAPQPAFTFTLPGSSSGSSSSAPAPALGASSFNFAGTAGATAAAASAPAGGGFSFNFPVPGASSPPKDLVAAAPPSPAPAPAPFTFAPAPASPASAATSAEKADSGVTPDTFDGQLDCLAAFYAQYDKEKDREECRKILDKRRGEAAAMKQSEFTKLCVKLQKKYGTNPMDMPEPTTTTTATGPLAVPAAAAAEASRTARVAALSKEGGDSSGTVFSSPSAKAPSVEEAGSGVTPDTFDGQLDCLAAFYAQYDKEKDREECRKILDKRRGEAAAMKQSEFTKLCVKLQKKYGTNPMDLGKK